jgi:hypothetical protein
MAAVVKYFLSLVFWEEKASTRCKSLEYFSKHFKCSNYAFSPASWVLVQTYNTSTASYRTTNTENTVFRVWKNHAASTLCGPFHQNEYIS